MQKSAQYNSTHSHDTETQAD